MRSRPSAESGPAGFRAVHTANVQHDRLLDQHHVEKASPHRPPGVTQQPEPPSHKTRSRVSNLSPRYRSQPVNYDPGQHTVACHRVVIAGDIGGQAPTPRATVNPRLTCDDMAEGGGFEPPRPLRAYPLSRRAHSAGLCDPSGNRRGPALGRSVRQGGGYGRPNGPATRIGSGPGAHGQNPRIEGWCMTDPVRRVMDTIEIQEASCPPPSPTHVPWTPPP
jgi:hypothetical protein